jgi:hypothetical protein
MVTKGDRLKHGRYQDGSEKTITLDPAIDSMYNVRDEDANIYAIPVEQLKSALIDQPFGG